MEEESEKSDDETFQCRICNECGNYWDTHGNKCLCDEDQESKDEGYHGKMCKECGNYWDNRGNRCVCDDQLD